MWERLCLRRWQRRFVLSQTVLVGGLVGLLTYDRLLAGGLPGWSLLAIGALLTAIAAWIGRGVEEDFVQENPHVARWMDHDESWWTRGESLHLSITTVLAWRSLRYLAAVISWPLRLLAGPR